MQHRLIHVKQVVLVEGTSAARSINEDAVHTLRRNLLSELREALTGMLLSPAQDRHAYVNTTLAAELSIHSLLIEWCTLSRNTEGVEELLVESTSRELWQTVEHSFCQLPPRDGSRFPHFCQGAAITFVVDIAQELADQGARCDAPSMRQYLKLRSAFRGIFLVLLRCPGWYGETCSCSIREYFI